ncbi:hypothetical protein Tco_1070584 [Tanacetum coccineum]|uniref:Integrase, catalytic region, zinc finger, CCHC-type, peptidase aspartic, catalytic n=1 Tax=Tanacetum coccineum TaxID=301880 RepID=A0ABQ5HNK1_9ASTR
MENRENGRMILNSVQNGPLVWPTIVQEDGTTRTKKYEELPGLPLDVYAIVNHHKVTKEIWDRVKLLMQGMKLSLQERERKLYDEFDKFSFVKGLAVLVFTQRDDPIACINKVMAFLSVVAASRQGQSYAGTGYKGEGHMARQCTQPKRTRNAAWFKERQCWLKHKNPTEDLDAYDSDFDDVSNAKAVLMANLPNYGLDVISEVPYFEPYHNDMDNKSVHAMQGFEQTTVVDFTDNKITSDSNIIPYSQYLQETQHAAVQDTNLYAQQDSMILSVIEQMSEQMINHVNNLEKANEEKNNESLTADLERYKERVKTFVQRLNIDLSTREKMIDSQMDDMIKEKPCT